MVGLALASTERDCEYSCVVSQVTRKAKIAAYPSIVSDLPTLSIHLPTMRAPRPRCFSRRETGSSRDRFVELDRLDRLDGLIGLIDLTRRQGDRRFSRYKRYIGPLKQLHNRCSKRLVVVAVVRLSLFTGHSAVGRIGQALGGATKLRSHFGQSSLLPT